MVTTIVNGTTSRLKKSESFLVFKSNILKLIQRSSNSVYSCYNPRGICLITRLRLLRVNYECTNLNMASKIR